ncbi:MAG: tRNA (adenosine(37)-N6)-threonylcarbamoyltransferase complex ATPase subunit type 1 TsaE [Desulfuromonas sp.]|nr:MAG: tRNA (adenosine(37)-N6)-threonylcarbamoyltransferase complex ATPase subunit type 1 TsaE [Desulfuromonas sp.]
MPQWTVVTVSAEETRLLGRLLGELVAPGEVFLVSGPLGAGKTCFAQGLAAGLGVPTDQPVTSPTYSLMHIHNGRIPFYHFDLYRLSHLDDLSDLGYDEFAEGDGLTLVEWADRIVGDLEASLEISIEKVDDLKRHFDFRAVGEGAEALVEHLAASWRVRA